jgi:hypothetical protein
MKSVALLLTTLCAAALLQGCATATAQVSTADAAPATTAQVQPVSIETAAPTQATPRELDELMAYLLHTRQMPSERLAQEARELRRLTDERNDIATLKLALLLSDQANSSETEVMGILQPIFDEGRGAKAELRTFALLLFRDMQDRKRMKDTLANAQSRLKESQRNQEATEAKAAQMRRQIDELQNKIDAFKMMEQSILKRGR